MPTIYYIANKWIQKIWFHRFTYKYHANEGWPYWPILKKDVIENYTHFKKYIKEEFNRINFINFFTLLILCNIFFSVGFFAITIFILVTIFILFYCHIISSFMKPVDDGISLIYSDILQFMESYIDELNKTRDSSHKLVKLSSLSSSLFYKDNFFNFKLLYLNYDRDFTSISLAPILLPLIHCLEINYKAIQSEYKILLLVKNNKNLRKLISLRLIQSFQKQINQKRIVSLDKKDQKFIFILYLYLNIIIK